MPRTFDAERVAALVRTARARQRLTLDQLAEKSGWSKSALWRIERGWFSRLPDPVRLSCLVAALHLDLLVLLTAAGYLFTENLTHV